MGHLKGASRGLGPGACIIKHLTDVFNHVVQQASAFAIVSHFLLALTNTRALYVTELITSVTSFMLQTLALLADQVKEACHGQTLQLIMNICKSRT